MSIRTIGLTLVSLVIAATPFVASAQSYNAASFCGYTYPYSTSNGYNNPGTCGPQTLLVYVQVVNPSNGYTNTYSPNSFNVSVSGNTASPASFAGSLSGTPVQLGVGSYSVTISNAPSNFTASYSPGCSGNIFSQGQGPLCVITESVSGNIYGSPTPYPYPYPYAGPSQLTCAPAYQTINIGQSATLTALNGTGGYSSSAYNWQTPSRSFVSIGPALTTIFQSTGVQSVTVSNGTQIATCTVNVTGAASPIVYSGSNPTSILSTYIPATYPRLPNTGFAPHTAAELALALALLGSAALLAYPYARNATLSLLN